MNIIWAFIGYKEPWVLVLAPSDLCCCTESYSPAYDMGISIICTALRSQ